MVDLGSHYTHPSDYTQFNLTIEVNVLIIIDHRLSLLVSMKGFGRHGVPKSHESLITATTSVDYLKGKQARQRRTPGSIRVFLLPNFSKS